VSAAVPGGRIFLKGKSYLWCIGKKEAEKESE
jgi:hypothetical protein